MRNKKKNVRQNLMIRRKQICIVTAEVYGVKMNDDSLIIPKSGNGFNRNQ